MNTSTYTPSGGGGGSSLLMSGKVGNIGLEQLGKASEDFFIPVRDVTVCGSTDCSKIMNFSDSAASYVKDEGTSISMSASEIDYSEI